MKISFRANNYFFKEILAFLFLLLAVYFFRKQRGEIVQAADIVQHANVNYVILGILLTILYVLLQGLMYVSSFKAVQSQITLFSSIKLFLRRNLISVFLPGGGITSLAFFTSEIESQGVSKAKTGFASYIYGVIGIASLVFVSIPVVGYIAFARGISDGSWMALSGLFLLIVIIVFATRSFLLRGWVYRQLVKISPQFESILQEVNAGTFSIKKILMALLWSIGVELCGIAHLYIAMKALGISVNWEVCISGYVVATLFFAISPFLRGLGAVEVSLIYILRNYGVSDIDSISVTVLYRVFEFWLPLLFGFASFGFSKGNIILRILPAILLALLGVVNIISVLTPPLIGRLRLLENFLPTSAIHLSYFATLISGILLLICATFLIRGLRNAWWIALGLSIISLLSNLTKAIDYEEALLACLSIMVLIATRKSYILKGDRRVWSFSIQTSLAIFMSVLIYGIIGFYFLDKRDFGIDFSLSQSILSTLKSFLLLDPDPEPLTRFAKLFVHSINFLGVVSIGLMVYAFVRPYIFKVESQEEEQHRAKAMLDKYGRTADDYFKSYFDKAFYFGHQVEGFIAYKLSSGFAIVLGEPVCADNPEKMEILINEFEKFCLDNGIKSAYYKIDGKWLDLFYSIGKKSLPIGQEAVVEVEGFSLEGKEKKSLRNALNALEKKGYFTKVYSPPIKDGTLQKLKLVSDEWIRTLNRKEIIFSSGIFDWKELKEQEIICIENHDEKIVAFLNVMPDYALDEGTYDLIRKTADAPTGVMDALIVKLIINLKEKGIKKLNMGMASMSGISKPKDVPEWVIKFAYERLRQFKHYHGIYEFKDKFNPSWTVKYLIYENHYDLTTLPTALNNVMRDIPDRE